MMKILMLSPDQSTRWNPGHQQFRDAVGQIHDVKYYGPGYEIFDRLGKLNWIPDVLKYYKENVGWEPDFVMTYGYRYTVPFTGIWELSIPKIHFLCDFTPPNRATYWPMCKRDKYDFYFCMSYQVMRWFDKNAPKEKIHFLPFGVDEKIFYPIRTETKWDIAINWSNHNIIYPLRVPIEKEVKKVFGGSRRLLIKRVFGKAFVNVINQSKINLNTSNLYRTMNMKNFEVMACSRLLMTEEVQEMTDLGYKDMVHYVAFKNEKDCVEKIKTLLEYPKMRNEIANYGYYLTLKLHTNLHRVQEMTEILHATF